jgi:hypothetical protein
MRRRNAMKLRITKVWNYFNKSGCNKTILRYVRKIKVKERR